MTKKALIILADGFEDIEAITPIDLLKRAGVQVTVAGLKSLQVKAAKSGLTVMTETTLESVQDDFDAIILPGGMPGAETLAQSEPVIHLIQNMHRQGKIIAAICAAPALVLTQAGILDGKSATCFTGMENHFSASTKFSAQDVVRDGNIITSRGAGTAFIFALTIIEALLDKKVRGKIAATTIYQENHT